TDILATLESQIAALHARVSSATSALTESLTTPEEINEAAKELKGNIFQETCLLEKSQQKLEDITKAYNRNQEKLAEKMRAITQLKIEQNKECEKHKLLVDTLANTISQFKGTIEDQEKQKAFQEKLDEF